MAKFQPLTLRDVDRIVEIESQSFQEPWSKDGFRDLITGGHCDNRGVFVDRKLAGYVFYYKVMNEIHIMNVAVDPAYRQKNLGSTLLDQVHEIGKKHQIQFVYLEVRETNLAAQKLYQKMGYQKQGRRINYYSNKEDALLMYKELSD